MADPNDQTPGMMGALSQLAYGDGPSPAETAMGALSKLLPTAEEHSSNRSKAWWANLRDESGNGTLGGAIGGANRGQLAWQLEQDKLRAQYIPLVMQSIVQSQQMALAASKASRDYLKEINPAIDSHLASMTAGGAQPTYQDAVTKILEFGRNNQIPPQILMSRIQSLPQDPAQLGMYLKQLPAANAPPAELLPKINANAAGQRQVESPVQGTAVPLNVGPGAGGRQPQQASNPSSSDVKFDTDARGDVGKFEEALRARHDAYAGMLARMNEQAQYIKNFQPGRYAGMAGGVSAAVKDIGARLPGIDKDVLEELAQKLIGAPPGSKDSLAAQQLFEQLAQQETLAQLRSSLGEGQRMNQSEFRAFQSTNLGTRMDPESFAGLRKFFFTQAAEAANKYAKWGEYVSDPRNMKPSVTGFDAPYSKKHMDYLLKGFTDVMPAGPDTSAPSYPELAPKPPPQSAPPQPVPTAAPAAINKPGAVDLSFYEPGARVGPTGKVYVLDKNGPRAAKKLENGDRRWSNREVGGKVQE